MSKKIKIKRFDKNIPLPEYKTKGAACFDLSSRETISIEPGQLGYVPLNIAVETPKNHLFLLAARSSTHKLGLMPVHGIGIGDSDFRGEGDEYQMPLLNFTKKTIKISKGTRVAQGTFIKHEKADWHEVKTMKSKTRGGFGSTGKK